MADGKIENRYRVEKIGDVAGKHATCRFFVLDLEHDPFAYDAMAAYAMACEKTLPMLAADIRERSIPSGHVLPEVSRLREALENAADDGHREMCETMRLYRGCTCHQAATLKALGWACPVCDGEGAIADADGRRIRHCAECDASGRAALATATAKGG